MSHPNPRHEYDPQLPSLRPRDPRWQLWLGILASNLVGFGAVGVIVLLTTQMDWNKLGRIGEWTQGTLIYSNFLLVPFGMGMVAAYFWRDLSAENMWGRIRLNFLFSLGGATIVFLEGVLCLIMASPLLIGLLGIGTFSGLHFWKKYPFLGVSVVPLLCLLLVADASTPHDYHNQATTDFHSNASPAALWRYTASYPAIPHSPDWWMWRLGLPAPVLLKGEARVGGRRDCLMTGNVSTGSRVVAVVPHRQIDFVTDKQPDHPEATNHFISQRGRIELLPDGRGGTILRATSWYQLKTFPAAYFDIFAASVMHCLHQRVFSHMDELARQDERLSSFQK